MIANLPPHDSLPVHLLSSSFNNTSATYKFYWFLAILNELEKGNVKINKQHLFAEMIASAWYTINYFNVSFGKQDKLQRAIESLRLIEGLAINEKQTVIASKLQASEDINTIKLLKYFDGEVPFRFLSPWFPTLKGDRNNIYQASQVFANDCAYAVNETAVTINPKWTSYLLQHSGILKAFCYWHLSLYLQKHNPNVPDIPNKLIKPAFRNGLSHQRKHFWDLIIAQHGSINCIYTNKSLNIGEYAVEHFLPYAFVSHDLIWNLIPADQIFNSSKSNKLPLFNQYFEPYFQLQKLAINTIINLGSKNKYLEDYLTFIPDFAEIKNLSEDMLRQKFRNNVQPLITIAANNGFEFLPT